MTPPPAFDCPLGIPATASDKIKRKGGGVSKNEVNV